MAADGPKPKLDPADLAAAERVFGIERTPAEREQSADLLGAFRERFERRRALPLPNDLPRALTFEVHPRPTGPSRVVRSSAPAPPLPSKDEDIAFAPLTSLSRWIERRALCSARLTGLNHERRARLGPELACVVTLLPERARAGAARADQEIASGRYRDPLHGIPWGAKDLLDTAGIATTWGAAPYRERVPAADATVVRRLDEAGAVLVAKLSLGELAMGDVWFGGQTRNPWKREQGSNGSSAGSAAAVAAGLVGFAIGSETTGSIESPCKRCGATGLRPTFGRVPRGGAMALAWSLDKLGPIARAAEDTLLVLGAIAGADAADPASRDAPLRFDAGASVAGRRVGHVRAWFEGGFAHPSDREVLAALARAGAELVPFELPDLPYDVLYTILFVEAAAAFEDLVASGGDDALAEQQRTSWPNLLRSTAYVSAVEYLQAERFRRRVIEIVEDLFASNRLDALVAPHFDGQLMLITNHTGHPGLTLRSGFRDDGTPLGVTVYGRPFEEGPLVELGMAVERDLGVGVRCPDLG